MPRDITCCPSDAWASETGRYPVAYFLLTPDDQSIPPAITIGDVTVTEGNTGTRVTTFLVTVSSPSSQAVTVGYATAAGTATVGSDFQATPGTLTFAPGETSKTVTDQVIGDRLPEANETFFVNLSGAKNALIADG